MGAPLECGDEFVTRADTVGRQLRVRGQIQRIVVTPKVGLKKSYQIIIGDPSRLPADGTGGAPDATGKRVWNVLNF